MTDGLEDVVAAHTVMSDVDGAAGRLIIRGRSLDDLAGRATFEEVARLLWDGFFDHLPADLAGPLAAARAEVFAEISAMDTGILALSPIEAMRALTARLADGDDLTVALRLLAAPAVFTAAVVRGQAGEAPIAPDTSLSHAADILRMLGKAPNQAEAEALDTYLVTVSDHGLNASTFAARVVASTRAGLGSAVLAGISALKAAIRRMGTRAGRLEFAEAVERAVLEILKAHKPGRSLDTNVEFYTALLLEALAFPPAAFTCVFAMGRTAGWIAHAREQLAGGRLIRPQSVYVGPTPRVAA